MYSLKLRNHIKFSKTAASANRAKGNRHVEILSSLYSDTSRFIEELLQNANDACLRNKNLYQAGKVRFVLQEDRLILYHNGIPFNEDDLIAITTIGQSTKSENTDVNLAGKFGLGFKSVFAVCHEPEIHSGKYHFKITDYEVLEETPAVSDQGFGTCIILPLKKDPNIRNIVHHGLAGICWKHILFVSGYDHIEISDGLKTETISRSVVKSYNNQLQLIRINNDHFLLFSAEKSKESPLFAFRVQTDSAGNLEYLPCSFENTFVYYPTLNVSGLKFLLHSGFTTTPAREQIPFSPYKTPENLHILKTISETISKLPEILLRQGLLNPGFWKMTPVFDTHELGNPIREAVYSGLEKTLLTKAVLPASDGTFCKQADLCVVSEDIASLFTNKEIQILFGRKKVLAQELTIVFQNNQLLRSRFKDIKHTDIRDFAFAITNHPEILNKKKNTAFHVSFLKIISKHPELWSQFSKTSWYNILEKPFILSASGKVCAPFSNGQAVLFIGEKGSRSFQTIHTDLLKDDEILSFLQNAGIPYSGELIEFERNIVRVFKSGNPGIKKAASTMIQFLQLLQKTPPEPAKRMIDILSDIPCIPVSAKTKTISLPRNVYFPEQDVMSFFQDVNIQLIDQKFLSLLYDAEPGGISTKNLLCQLGVNKRPAYIFFEQTQRKEDYKKEEEKINESGLTVRSGLFTDCDIDGLDHFLSSPTLRQSVTIASMLTEDIPEAEIQFETYTKKISVNITPQFIIKLKDSAWLFDVHLTPGKPHEITDLHPAYSEKGINLSTLGRVFGQKFNQIILSPEETAYILKLREFHQMKGQPLLSSVLTIPPESDFPDLSITHPLLLDLRSTTKHQNAPISIETKVAGNIQALLNTLMPVKSDRESWFYNNPVQKRAIALAIKALGSMNAVIASQEDTIQDKHNLIVLKDVSGESVYASVSGIKVASGLFIFPEHTQFHRISYYITVDELFSQTPIVSIRTADDPGGKTKGFLFRNS